MMQQTARTFLGYMNPQQEVSWTELGARLGTRKKLGRIIMTLSTVGVEVLMRVERRWPFKLRCIE
jgi:hypothetical protein